jgi:YidC/Oxa1 family membrane protein insertase
VTASRPSSPAASACRPSPARPSTPKPRSTRRSAFEDIAAKKAKFVTKAADGWASMVQHYFVAGWAPAEGEREFFANQVSSDLYSAGVIVPVAAIAPGQSR